MTRAVLAMLAFRVGRARRNTVGSPRQARAHAGIFGIVPDDPRPPVAIRITRPYATEDDLLEQELETLTRTSVTLLGAQPRPQGVVLRFELVLSSGIVVLRGEGRVVGFRPNAHHGLGGLTLRFTRLDSKSKALVDKVAALRERRRLSALPGVPAAAAEPPSSPEPPQAVAPKPPPSIDLESTRAEAPRANKPAPPPSPGPASVPPDRDALLDRLRARAKTLDSAAVRRILELGRRAGASQA
jgi:hypothetical protein